MAQGSTLDWQRIVADPRFQALHRKKTSFLWGLMVFSIVYYFLLPIGAAYFQDIYKIKVWGPVNVGLLFALSEFIVAWGIAFIYSRRANSEFDAMAGELIRNFGILKTNERRRPHDGGALSGFIALLHQLANWRPIIIRRCQDEGP